MVRVIEAAGKWAAMFAAVTMAAGAAVAGDKRGDETRPAQKDNVEKSAYLGVSTAPVDPALADQMGLPNGVGLVVEYVEAESPASKALQVHDILRKFNDQILINFEQLAVLVRLQKPGDEVKLTFVRKGKDSEVSVKLAEKDLPMLKNRSWNSPRIIFGPPEMPNLKMWMDQNGFNDMPPMPPMDPPGLPQPPSSVPRNARESMHLKSAPGGGGAQSRSVVVGGEALSVLNEGGKTYILSLANNQKYLTVKEGNKTVFEGVVTTDADRQKLPKDIAEKLPRIEGVKQESKPTTLVPDGKLL
ncbi:MAG: hypothetical protein C0404_03660 [Verrucomicrobia bacterium]|nr:hypothetical protein [Verrucomicrobiota bacterium]